MVLWNEFSPTPIARCTLRPSEASRICHVPAGTEVAAPACACGKARSAGATCVVPGDAFAFDAAATPGTATAVAAAIGVTATAVSTSANRPSAPGRRRPVTRRVEQREHPALELPRTRHADGEGRRPIAAERMRDLEQMPRVLARLRSRRQHAVVTRQLAFHAKPPRHPPGRRDAASRAQRPLRRASA